MMERLRPAQAQHPEDDEDTCTFNARDRSGARGIAMELHVDAAGREVSRLLVS